MPLQHTITAAAVQLVLLATLAGLARTGRVRCLWSFTAYVAAALVGNVLTTWWPAVFWTRWFYDTKIAVYAVLTLLLVVEFSWRAVRPFPRLLPGTRRLELLALTLLGCIVLREVLRTAPENLAAAGFDRIREGSVWLLIIVLGLCLYYRIPIEPFRRGVAVAYGVWLALLAAAGNLDVLIGGPVTEAIRTYTHTFGFLALASVWCWCAWRRAAPATEAYHQVIAEIQARFGTCGSL